MEAYVLKYRARLWLSRLWRWVRGAAILAALAAGLVYLAREDKAPIATGKDALIATGMTVQAVDGDSISIIPRKVDANAAPAAADGMTVRLYGIDAPEYRQNCTRADGTVWACGKDARTALAKILRAGDVACDRVAYDRYQRTLGKCRARGVEDVAAQMVRSGWAMSGAETSDSRYRNGGPYVEQEMAAQQERLGIWQGKMERPADYRARTKSGVGTTDH